MGITGRIMILVVLVVFFSVAGITGIGYQVNSQQVEEAAGLELIGCASITSGLVTPSDLQDLIEGDDSKLKTMEKQVDWIVDHKPIFMNAAVMTLDGKLLIPDKRLQKEGFHSGDVFYIDQEAVEHIKQSKHPSYSGIYQFGEYERKTGYAPIFEDHDPSKPIIALMAIDFDASVIKNRTWEMLGFTLQYGLIFPILGAIISFVLVRRIVGPLKRMNEQVKAVAEGDLTRNIAQLKTKDEVGQLSQSINSMITNLRMLIQQLQVTSSKAASSSEELSAHCQQTVGSSNQITAFMQEVATGAHKQEKIVEDSKKSLNDMFHGIQDIAVASLKVADSAMDTAEQAEQGNRNIEKSIKQIESVREDVQETIRNIHNLKDHSQGINQILQLITSVADQTNLLALNAAIEAARAGEHGRGFAVVADEVRKLAEQTSSSTSQVATMIQAIQAETVSSVESMSRVQQSVQTGVHSVYEAGESFKQILQSAQHVAGQIQGVTSTSQEISASSEQIQSLVGYLMKFVGVAAENAQSVAASTKEQLYAIEEISGSTEFLTGISQELESLLAKFRL